MRRFARAFAARRCEALSYLIYWLICSLTLLLFICLFQTGLVQLDGEWELKEFADDYPKFEKRMAEQEPYWKIGTVKFN